MDTLAQNVPAHASSANKTQVLPQAHTDTHQTVDKAAVVIGGKRLSAMSMNKMADTSSDQDNMSPVPHGNETISYGIVQIAPEAQTDLRCASVPNKVQRVSSGSTGVFYIYHETGHGVDSYLVVYSESGLISTASNSNPALVEMSGQKWDDSTAGRGFVLYQVDSRIAPTLNNSHVSWVASSPKTINQSVTRVDSTSDTYSTTVSLETKSDGTGGASVSQSESYQIGHSYQFQVTDWNVDETSDASSKTCQWIWYQTTPWSGKNDPNAFGQWWQDAYNVGGGWDDVKGFTAISTTSFQYHTSAAWRFDASLVTTQPDGSKHLSVTFNGGLDCHYCLIAMPQLAGTGHHQMFTNTLSNPWTHTLDLVALSSLT